MTSEIRQVLKNVCFSNGWCYGLFWGVNSRNSMLLTIEEAYFEEKCAIIMNDSLQQVHMLGEGIIGEAAFTGKHQWMFSDASFQYLGPSGSTNNQDVFQDVSEFHRQFSSGIKTIALITVAPLGVLQFGSTEKIPERLDFVNHTKNLFQQLASLYGQASRNAPTTSNCEVYDQNNTAASVFYSGSSCANYVNSNATKDSSVKELMESIQSAMVVPQTTCFSSGQQNDNLIPLMSSSFHLQTQFRTDGRNPIRSSEESTWTVFDQQMLSGMGMEEPPDSVISNSHTPVSCRNESSSYQGDTTSSFRHSINRLDDTTLPSAYSSGITSSYEINKIPTIVDNTIVSAGYSLDKLVDDQLSIPLLDATVSELLNESTAFQMSTSEERPNTVNEHETSQSNSIDHEKANFTVQLPGDSDLFDNLGLGFEQIQRIECWDDYMLPVVSGSHSSLSTGASECISDFDVPKGVFKDLEQLLEGVTSNSFDTRLSTDDQLSTTTTPQTRRTFHNPASQYCLGGAETKDDSRTKCRPDNRQTELKAHVGSWIDDSYSISMESGSSIQSKKAAVTAKGNRKKGQSRESTRPRPKDRQQIQDRVKELREIVPNGSKCSIDALLDRTIKHMLFLQSVTKYSDKVKQVNEPKIIGDENGVVLKDNLNGGGSTWVFEVGGQTMVCPIIVEDLNPIGQMLIEMLCEERGYFLEIADTIRGFGLTILKGVMEIRDEKIWARFIVEANRDITRMDIFLSLVQLLQQTTTGINSKNGSESGVSEFKGYTPLGLTDPLH
ncbi:hypothetical protein ACHQM5_011874 [Ranunculus cassubicifolius]